MNIAILGTRGIPNKYGGYERLAELLAIGLAKRGHKITVYNAHNHPYQQSVWKNIDIIHVEDTEFRLGSLGRFIYNYDCVKNLREKNFDIILQLDYTTLSLFGFLFPKDVPVVTLVDAMSGKLVKHSKLMQQYLPIAEKLAVKRSNLIITDTQTVKNQIQKKYNKEAVYIPFGAEKIERFDKDFLNDYQLKPFEFNMLNAEITPENKLEVILDGVVQADIKTQFLVVGNHSSHYAYHLREKYKNIKNISFLGAIYDNGKLNSLRHYSNICFQSNFSYSANLFLLNAMAAGALIVANENLVNKELLGDDAFYFNDSFDVAKHLIKLKKGMPEVDAIISNNLHKVATQFNWNRVIDEYEWHFQQEVKKHVKELQMEQTER
ncbi:MAG: DUF1972 domain-containing protein [Flavobacterium sp.]|nr:MAG: DUF1972 domain-containing protein [Flavobacterium sp.]